MTRPACAISFNFFQPCPQPRKPNKHLAFGAARILRSPIRINSLNSQLPNYPANGQRLAERYAWYVNPPAFTHEGGATGASTPAAGEVDGIVSQGVVVLTGGKLAEGTRVKVRPQQ